MPILGWFIGQLTTTVYEARTSILVQESAKHNPFMKDISVDTNLKKRMPGLSTLLRSKHVLEKVLMDTGGIVPGSSAYERDAAVRRLSSSLTVNLVGPDLVAFSFRSPEPAGMAKILEAVRNRFVERLLSPERTTIEGSQAFLKSQMQLRREELELAEKGVSRFSKQTQCGAPRAAKRELTTAGRSPAKA